MTTRPLTGMTGSIPLRMIAMAWLSCSPISVKLAELGTTNAKVSGVAMRNATSVSAMRLTRPTSHAGRRYVRPVHVITAPRARPASITNCHGGPDTVGRSRLVSCENARARIAPAAMPV